MIETKKVHVRGIEYAITDSAGQGVPVMLVHGWPDDRTIWRHQQKYLGELGYRVISVDWAGHGDSSKPEDISRYHITELGLDTVFLLDALKIDKVHLIAHDYGATVSWETVANYPKRFQSFCAISVGHAVEILRDIAKGHLFDYLWLILHGMDKTSKHWYLSNEAKRFKEKFASHPDANYILSKLLANKETLFWTLWERANPSYNVIYRHYLKGQKDKKITVPTFAIYSKDDEWMTEGQLARSSKYVSSTWRYECVEGGHWVQLQNPRFINELLESWLSSQSVNNAKLEN